MSWKKKTTTGKWWDCGNKTYLMERPERENTQREAALEMDRNSLSMNNSLSSRDKCTRNYRCLFQRRPDLAFTSLCQAQRVLVHHPWGKIFTCVQKDSEELFKQLPYALTSASPGNEQDRVVRGWVMPSLGLARGAVEVWTLAIANKARSGARWWNRCRVVSHSSQLFTSSPQLRRGNSGACHHL